jgi:hypothetical protein
VGAGVAGGGGGSGGGSRSGGGGVTWGNMSRCRGERRLNMRRGGRRSEHAAWLLLRVRDMGRSHCSGPCEGVDSAAVTQAWAWLSASAAAQAAVREARTGAWLGAKSRKGERGTAGAVASRGHLRPGLSCSGDCRWAARVLDAVGCCYKPVPFSAWSTETRQDETRQDEIRTTARCRRP